ncbi:hypothetical protein ACFV0Y_16520 [Streptomyces sp. NPDC059569]|uniref:hypothetical protein n=1 Tax=Streptomyces sp. NPDC059569 TaxID=3346869 RepID=UPI0036B861D3
MTTTRPLPDHGTLSRHKYHGCKCDTCVENYRAYQRSRHRKQGYGTWQPLIDAGPVRQHLLALNAAGFSWPVIAERVGCRASNINSFIYDKAQRPARKRVTPELAARILAVTAADLTPGTIDATGTTRRLQALASVGWPLRSLGPHIGIAEASVGRIRHQKWVFRPTAAAVAETYDQLRDERPEDHGVPAWVALKTRRWAARQQWRDPLWWDDMGHIDDPAFDPEVAEAELNRDQLAAHRRAEVEHLAGFGLPDRDIAARLGMNEQYVHALIRELRTGQRRDRTGLAA